MIFIFHCHILFKAIFSVTIFICHCYILFKDSIF